MIEFIDYLTPVIGALFLSVLTFIAMFLVRNEKRKQDEAKKSSAELSYMREYFERELNRLNSKLMSNDDRWKEVNHLLLSYEPKFDREYFQVSQPTLSRFFVDVGVDPNSTLPDPKLIFVLTPFLKDYEPTFNHISEICENLGFHCIRGDEEFVRGNVFKYILEKIISSRLVIANLDGRNPNVMYELGIAHAIGKPTILVAKRTTDVPFDIKSNYMVLYSELDELGESLKSTIGKFLVDSQVWKFVISKRMNGEYQFNLKANNGATILASEGYSDMDSCLRAVGLVRTYGSSSGNYEISRSRYGKYYFVLKSPNGQAIGSSEMYESIGGARDAVAKMLDHSSSATVTNHNI